MACNHEAEEPIPGEDYICYVKCGRILEDLRVGGFPEGSLQDRFPDRFDSRGRRRDY